MKIEGVNDFEKKQPSTDFIKIKTFQIWKMYPKSA